jgi:hypothetical protein
MPSNNRPVVEPFVISRTLNATLVERAGQMTVTISWHPLNPTEIEHKTFDDGRQSMTMGWAGTFEQLENYLAKAS